VAQASYSSGSTAADTSMGVLVGALSAAFLGSTISASREFDVVGTTVAAMFVSAVGNGLILNGLSNLVLPGVQGAILIGAVLVAVIRERQLGQVAVF
jgi:ribose/xylose/arabinose/galactoside ABC-type transport system permease subunit